ncbi:MAG: hypothetical protein V7782_01970 [Psychromonas sp.]
MTESIPAKTKEPHNKGDAATRWTKRLVLLCAIIWVWHLFADRFTPYSEHSRIRTFATL